KRLGFDHGANPGAGGGQRANVFRVQRGQLRADAFGQPVKLKKLAERMRRGGKPGGDAHAGGQLRDHLAETGVFAANRLDIGHSQVFKRYDQGGLIEKRRHGKAPEVKTGSAWRVARRSAPATLMRTARLCFSWSGSVRCMGEFK